MRKSTSKPLVLLVDDEIAQHNNLVYPLEIDYNLISVYNVETAKIIISQIGIDLVIVDLHFKLNNEGFAGIPFIEHTRKNHPDLPLVAITGFIKQPNIKQLSLDAGANTFLSKNDFSPQKWKNIFDEFLKSRVKKNDG